MREVYGEWYLPDDDELINFVTRGRIVLDANVLLDLYRHSAATRESLLMALEQEQVRDRLFLPYQAGLEYHRTRLSEAASHDQQYADVLKSLDKTQKDALAPLLESISKLRDKHVQNQLRKDAEKSIGKAALKIQKAIEKQRSRNVLPPRELRTNDPIRDRIEELLSDEGQIGDKPTAEEDAELQSEWVARKKAKLPPGLRDADKDDGGHGDFYIWHEMKKLAKTSHLPVVFVSADDKNDWMHRVKGEAVGPLPALRTEFIEETDQGFHKVTWSRFLEHLNRYLDSNVGADVIEEVRDYSRAPLAVGSESYMKAIGLNPASAAMEAAFRSIKPPPGGFAQATLRAAMEQQPSSLTSTLNALRLTNPEAFESPLHQFLRSTEFGSPVWKSQFTELEDPDGEDGESDRAGHDDDGPEDDSG